MVDIAAGSGSKWCMTLYETWEGKNFQLQFEIVATDCLQTFQHVATNFSFKECHFVVIFLSFLFYCL